MKIDIKRISGVFYDWDGTLIRFRDKQFLYSMNTALSKLGYPQIPSLENSKSIRHSFFKAAQCPKKAEELFAIFRQEFTRHTLSETDLLPGAKSLLEFIYNRNIPQGIASNLDHQILTQEVQKLGISKYCPVTIGSINDNHLKPNPHLLLSAIKIAGVPIIQPYGASIQSKPNKEILYVGDSLGGRHSGQPTWMYFDLSKSATNDFTS